MTRSLDPRAEWLEADGLGGFASGTVGGVRTRRYHALLLAALTPPTGRFVLVNGFDAHVEGEGGRHPFTSQLYAGGHTHPAGGRPLLGFTTEPWPTWRFRLDDGSELEQQLFVPRGMPLVALSWRLAPSRRARLVVRPFLSGRDYHALHHENPHLRFDAEVVGRRVTWRTYPDVPGVVALSNGAYRHRPWWYRSFLYEEERARGLDHVEDLAAPGELAWQLEDGEAVLVLAAELPGAVLPDEDAATLVARLRAAESARRAGFASAPERSAEAFLVRRGEGGTIVAGYPWFTDWGRDTFIALRGLCLSTGRLEDARRILLQWAGTVSQGMLPNRFPDQGEHPEYNSVDAALWYVVAVHDYLRARPGRGEEEDERALRQACLSILEGYARGTRHGIRAEADGLLAAGEPGVQLTWMDARVAGREVTPRIGKPVEVQALWLNALRVAAGFEQRWDEAFQRGRASFAARFWNEAAGALHDVVDVDHRPGTADPAFRANQILAVGGLPFALLDGERARRMVDAVERRLWTPLGLRTLAPDEPGYRPTYGGGSEERDGAYHQGTVWPWLMGPFVEAWLRVRGGGAQARAQARARFLEPLLSHLQEAGLDHVSEVADGQAPHLPGGCPFQAWSLGELLRGLALTATDRPRHRSRREGASSRPAAPAS